jgi:tripartite-type tricarboxylate transporter receptor subunit TctC
MNVNYRHAVHSLGRCIFATALLGIAGLAAAHGQNADAFYQSHKLTLGVPNGPGGGYDIYVRALGRHIAKHIPGNPTIVVQNVPAGGGMALANMIYATAPKDGSYIGMVRGTVIQEQIYKNPQVHFDGRKFAWVGNMNSDYDTCIVWATSGIKSIDDFYTHEIVVGASGVGAQSYSFPVAYRDLLGMKLKVIAGYPGTPDRILAMERGELTGACGISTSSLSSALHQLLVDRKIRVIAQGGAHKDPRYPDVPNILDQAKTSEVHQALEFLFVPLALGRAMAGPPETPKDRLAVLREGMADTLKDPAFLADAKKVGIDIEPGDYKESEALVAKLFATPPKVVARIQAALQ